MLRGTIPGEGLRVSCSFVIDEGIRAGGRDPALRLGSLYQCSKSSLRSVILFTCSFALLRLSDFFEAELMYFFSASRDFEYSSSAE